MRVMGVGGLPVVARATGGLSPFAAARRGTPAEPRLFGKEISPE